MKKQIDVATRTVTFSFDDNIAPIVFHFDKMHENNKMYAGLHGMSARIGDTAAIARKGADGKIITVTEAMRAADVQELAAYYEGGATEWNVKGKMRAPVQNPTILAIAAKRGVTYAEAEALLAEQFLTELA